MYFNYEQILKASPYYTHQQKGTSIMERLDKILSSQGICTRKEARKLAGDKKITVNGITIRKTDIKVDPDNDIIEVGGKRVEYKKYVYIMMNKPKGVLSASTDRNAQTVIDLLPEEYKRNGLFPAGRLDRDTTGLIIITDDGDFAHRMLAPKKHVPKLYKATLDAPITDSDKQILEQGMTLRDGTKYSPAKVKTTNGCIVEIEISEGKFHQVKNMFAFVGKTVENLERLRIGGLFLDKKLSHGECRYLNNSEITAIFNSDNY